MMPYNVQDWFWIVGGDETRVWSSAAAAYVPATNSAYQAWLESGASPTRIDTEANLEEVFAQQFPAGWPGLAIKKQLADLDALLPRSLESYWEATSFDTSHLHAKQLEILNEKRTLRAQLS